MTVRNIFFAVLLAFCAFLLANKVSEARKTNIPIQELTSKGGLKVWFVQDKSLPIVQLAIAWRMKSGGSATSDTSEKAGLTKFLSTLLDEGAGGYDALTFQEKLSDSAIRLSFSTGLDTFSGSLKYLTRHEDEAIELLHLAITKPRFDKEAMERMRASLLATVKRAESDPQSIASKAWWARAFNTPPHPYELAQTGTQASLATLSQDDLLGLHQRLLAKDNLVIGVVGDITPERLLENLDKAFGQLPEKANVTPPSYQKPKGAQVIHIEFDSPQTEVIFGQAGLGFDHPDFYAAYVMNYILGGGGFSSRFTEEIRAKRGLVYSVYSYLYPLDYSALWIGGLATANVNRDKAIELVKSEMRRIQTAGVTAQELENAKNYLIGAYPLRLDSGGKIATHMRGLQLNGFKTNHHQIRKQKIEAVTLDDVQRVARDMLKPDSLLIVTVGKKEDSTTISKN